MRKIKFIIMLVIVFVIVFPFYLLGKYCKIAQKGFISGWNMEPIW